jgi:hypothetical protein
MTASTDPTDFDWRYYSEIQIGNSHTHLHFIVHIAPRIGSCIHFSCVYPI